MKRKFFTLVDGRGQEFNFSFSTPLGKKRVLKKYNKTGRGLVYIAKGLLMSIDYPCTGAKAYKGVFTPPHTRVYENEMTAFVQDFVTKEVAKYKKESVRYLKKPLNLSLNPKDFVYKNKALYFKNEYQTIQAVLILIFALWYFLNFLLVYRNSGR